MTTKKQLAYGPSLRRALSQPWSARSFCGTAALLACHCASAPAQEKSADAAMTAPAQPPPKASAGLLNDWLRQESSAFAPWDIGGQVRGRFEHKSYFAVPNEAAVDFRQTGDSGNTYGLLRARVHLGYTPSGWFRAYAEVQDSTALNDDRKPSPDEDHFLMRQAWIGLGDAKDFPLVLKAGRQEMIYGDQRLIGIADWLNFGRTFDAAKLRFENSDFWVDAFVSQPVLPDRHEFDRSNDNDRFSGIYGSTRTLVPFQESQLYFLARNTDETPADELADKPVQYAPASPRDIYTIGGRVKSLPLALGGWDYEAEGAYQFGRFKVSNTSASLDQDAYALHAAGGYTWVKTAYKPRVGLEYNYGSGDSGKAGGHGTFDNLFPSNHGLYGLMDFFSLQNMQELRLAASFKPTEKLTVRLDGYAFWLADTHDYFYQGNGGGRKTGGYGINPGYDNFVGSELDLIATYAMTPYASVQGGYGHFFVGDYIKSSLATHGGATDANFFYAQLTFNF
jgi:Alginate export